MGNGGHAAFASILWSPPLRVQRQDHHKNNRKENFQSWLTQVPCDVLLVFGKDDPWVSRRTPCDWIVSFVVIHSIFGRSQCKPAFAKKMLQALDQRQPHQVHRYIEIENAGHCPNHEAPQAVAHVVRSWMDSDDRSKEQLTLVDGGESDKTAKMVFQEEWGETIATELGASDIFLGVMDHVATTFI
jgi:pimeloyl-ACP methyl ester carboxylesterase